jgi:Concanavalin A-like lectin/glucanases superfamily
MNLGSTRRATLLGALVIAAAIATALPAGGSTGRQTAAEVAPVLRADYRFQHTLASSRAGARALTKTGPGTLTFATETVDGVPRTVVQFPDGTGLQLAQVSTVIPHNRYTMVVLMRLDEVAGYQRIINLARNASDGGLYVNDGVLEFFPLDPAPSASIAADQWVQVVLTRSSGGRLRGYVDGVMQFDFPSTTRGKISDADFLWFFRDDTNHEESSGAVARIRLYDRPLGPVAVADLNRLPGT